MASSVPAFLLCAVKAASLKRDSFIYFSSSLLQSWKEKRDPTKSSNCFFCDIFLSQCSLSCLLGASWLVFVVFVIKWTRKCPWQPTDLHFCSIIALSLSLLVSCLEGFIIRSWRGRMAWLWNKSGGKQKPDLQYSFLRSWRKFLKIEMYKLPPSSPIFCRQIL